MNIDELLEKAASLPIAERETFLEKLPEEERLEVHRFLAADQILQQEQLLQPLAPNPLGRRTSTASSVKSLRDYQLKQKIGTGGMGDVFLATHSKLQRQVALKILPPSRLHDDELVTRFEREMEAIGQLHHPNIVQALDAGKEDGQHYLALEYVDGLDAKQLVSLAGLLSESDACEIIRQTALGLDHIHQRQFVHRDIKPSNLLVGSDGTVKIADLGLALLAQNEQLTVTGAFMGTPDFVAPEQIESSQSVDTRTDLYSLGCTLYYLLAGHAPFETEEYSTLLNKINAQSNSKPKPISQLREVSSDLDKIILRLLEKDPAERFQTAREVVEILQPMSQGANLPRLVSFNRQLHPEALLDTVVPKAASTAPVSVVDEAIEAKPKGETSSGQTNSFRWKLVASSVAAVLAAIVLWSVWKPTLDPAPLSDTETKQTVSSSSAVTTESSDSSSSTVPPTNVADAKRQYDRLISELSKSNPLFDASAAKPVFEDGKLVSLRIASGTLRDLTPLSKMTDLRALSFWGATFDGGVADISCLRDLHNLEAFHCHSEIDDLSPLAGLPLKTLYIWNWRGSDLSPLAGLPLTTLNCGGATMQDLSPLKGMQLEWLCINSTHVEDVSPLAGMPLKVLMVADTGVTDLGPLDGMQIENLAINNGTQLDDWGQIADFPLNELTIDEPVNHEELIGALPSLKILNGKSVGVFRNSLETVDGARNVAFNKPAYFMSLSGFLNSPLLAVDGDTTEVWGEVAGSGKWKKPYWEVDLGDFFEISKIEVYGPTDDLWELDHIGIFVKKAALDRGQLFTEDSNDIRYEKGLTHITRSKLNGGRVARFVRIQKNVDFGYLMLAEVKVFGKPCSPTPEQLKWHVNPERKFYLTSCFTSYSIWKDGEFGTMNTGGPIRNGDWFLEPSGVDHGFYLKESRSGQHLYLGDNGQLRVGEIEKENAPSAIWVFEPIEKNRHWIRNHKSSVYLHLDPVNRGPAQGTLIIGELEDKQAAHGQWIVRDH